MRRPLPVGLALHRGSPEQTWQERGEDHPVPLDGLQSGAVLQSDEEDADSAAYGVADEDEGVRDVVLGPVEKLKHGMEYGDLVTLPTLLSMCSGGLVDDRRLRY